MPRMKSSDSLVWWLTVMAGLSSLSSAAIVTDLIGQQWAATFLAVVGSLNAGTAAYVAAARPVESPPPRRRRTR
jgi:hypothetical protein